MSISPRHSTANPITALLAVQLLLVGAGYLLTRILVHFWSKVYGPDLSTDSIDWGRLVVRFGLWALILPCIWGLWATLGSCAPLGRGSVSRSQLVSGLVVTLLLLLAFGWTIGLVLLDLSV